MRRYPNLFEIACEANLETFNKNQSSRKKAEELLYKYIDESLKALLKQKKELKELILLCLGHYKTFIAMQKETMRVSEKLTPELELKRMEKELKEPDLERLN